MDWHRSFSLPVILRILKTLREQNPGINKTGLAGKTGLNYGTCVMYVDFLTLLGWVSSAKGHKGLITITQSGIDFMRLLLQRAELGNVAMSELGGMLDLSASELPSLVKRDQDSEVDSLINAIGRKLEDRDFQAGKILLVEDEPDLIITYKVTLAELGFDVVAFTSPELALREFRENTNRYDLILSDIRMDSMNGLQLYREMKALRPQIRIIFISALDAAPELTSILPGFRNEDLLAKPVNRDTLAKKVQSAVAESRVYLRGIRT